MGTISDSMVCLAVPSCIYIGSVDCCAFVLADNELRSYVGHRLEVDGIRPGAADPVRRVNGSQMRLNKRVLLRALK